MKTILKQQSELFFLDSMAGNGPARHHLLCVHGLNQNPLALKPFLSDLNSQGIHCHLLHLPGHLHDQDLNKRVNKDQVIEAYGKAYALVKQYSHHDQVPMGFLGYSYGGLIGTSLLNEYKYSKVVLLAPALKLKPYAMGIRAVLPILSRVFSVPLGARRYEERYRFHHRGVPRAVYRSFFQMYDQFQLKMGKHELLGSTKGLVFVHPRDELVSYRRLNRFLKKYSQWQLKTLDNKNAEFGRYKHLIFDEVTLGKETYRSLLQDTLDFLMTESV